LGNRDVHPYTVPTANKVAMIIHGEPREVGNPMSLYSNDMEVVYNK
jgi:hypothetical protein